MASEEEHTILCYSSKNGQEEFVTEAISCSQFQENQRNFVLQSGYRPYFLIPCYGTDDGVSSWRKQKDLQFETFPLPTNIQFRDFNENGHYTGSWDEYQKQKTQETANEWSTRLEIKFVRLFSV